MAGSSLTEGVEKGQVYLTVKKKVLQSHVGCYALILLNFRLSVRHLLKVPRLRRMGYYVHRLDLLHHYVMALVAAGHGARYN